MTSISPKNVSPDQINTHLKNTHFKYTIIKLGATWCGPCKQISPILQNLIKSNNSVELVDIDVDDNVEIYVFYKKMLRVKGLPTVLLYRKNEYNEDKFYIPHNSVVGYNPNSFNYVIKEFLSS